MKRLVLAFVLCFLISCTAGPVFIAKNEDEGIRSSYQDRKLNELTSQNQEKLRDIYRRYQLAKVDVYPQGIGFTTLSDDQGKRHYYLLVDVRPRDISFGMGQTKPKERLSEVIQHQFEKNLRLVKEGDMNMSGIDGLAFTVHWPVRDLSQCDSHGGFLEYAMVYFRKGDFARLMQGETSFTNTIKNAEVITSLEMKEAKAVKVVDGQ